MIERVAVVVPARDEQDTLPACLDSLRVAARELQSSRPDLDVRTVLVLDECTDGSPGQLAGAGDLDVLQVRARSAGGARAAGAAHALRSGAHAGERTWLANTDADSRVPRDWLVEMVEDAERGAHLVLGTVEPDDDLDPSIRERWRARHLLVEGHPHVHAA
ncbi:MAG: glycosyltransferase, partial [Actinobacteria bacterium]|nr:glycosyltransferase [Actinomycetota bacterium]